MTRSASPISLIVLDIDGVITDGEARALDLTFLAQLADLNAAARAESGRPAITLCTGRPAPYLEVMQQAIDSRLPGIFENGAGLYLPEGYQFLAHPQLAADGGVMPEVQHRLESGLVSTGRAYFQPGKIHTLTLFPQPPTQVGQLHELASEALGPLIDQVELAYSISCLNVLPRGIDKGKGIEFLAERSGIPPAAMLGVGDSDVDLPFLARVGHSAAPANAFDSVKSMVDHISPHPTSEGVMEILQHFELLP